MTSASTATAPRLNLTDIPFAITVQADGTYNLSVDGKLADKFDTGFSSNVSAAEIIDQGAVLAFALEAGYRMPARVSQKDWEDFVFATAKPAAELSATAGADADDADDADNVDDADAGTHTVAADGSSVTAPDGTEFKVPDANSTNADAGIDAGIDNDNADAASTPAEDIAATFAEPIATGPDAGNALAEAINKRFHKPAPGRRTDLRTTNFSAEMADILNSLDAITVTESSADLSAANPESSAYLKALTVGHGIIMKAMLAPSPAEADVVTLMRKNIAASGSLSLADCAALRLALSFARSRYDDVIDNAALLPDGGAVADELTNAAASAFKNHADDKDATGMRRIMDMVSLPGAVFVTYDGTDSWRETLPEAFSEAYSQPTFIVVAGPQGFPICGISRPVVNLWNSGRLQGIGKDGHNGEFVFRDLGDARAVITEIMRRRLEGGSHHLVAANRDAGGHDAEFAILDFVWDIEDSAGRFLGADVSGARFDVAEDLADMWLDPDAAIEGSAKIKFADASYRARNFSGDVARIVADIGDAQCDAVVADPVTQTELVAVDKSAAALVASSPSSEPGIWSRWLTATITNAVVLWERHPGSYADGQSRHILVVKAGDGALVKSRESASDIVARVEAHQGTIKMFAGTEDAKS